MWLQRLRITYTTSDWSWTTMKSHRVWKRSLSSGRRCWQLLTGPRSKWTWRLSTLLWRRVKSISSNALSQSPSRCGRSCHKLKRKRFQDFLMWIFLFHIPPFITKCCKYKHPMLIVKVFHFNYYYLIKHSKKLSYTPEEKNMFRHAFVGCCSTWLQSYCKGIYCIFFLPVYLLESVQARFASYSYFNVGVLEDGS